MKELKEIREDTLNFRDFELITKSKELEMLQKLNRVESQLSMNRLIFTDAEQKLLEEIIIEKQLEKDENNHYVNTDNGINEMLEDIKIKLFSV